MLCRRDCEARRAADEERRGPAFWSVFWAVRSRDSWASAGTTVGVKVAWSSLVGDGWVPGRLVPGPEGPEKEGFFRMPVRVSMYMRGGDGCELTLWPFGDIAWDDVSGGGE